MQADTPGCADGMHDLPLGQSASLLQIVELQRFVSMKTALGAHFCTHLPSSQPSFTPHSALDLHPPIAAGGAVAVPEGGGGFFAPAVAAPVAPVAIGVAVAGAVGTGGGAGTVGTSAVSTGVGVTLTAAADPPFSFFTS